MELKELAEFLIKSIALNTESVIVEEKECDDNVLFLMAKVNDDDFGRIIGKDGKIINSIRILLQEASSLKNKQYIKFEIEKC